MPEVDACVHCGLCLNQCPTYRVTHLEAESPRGRIYLVEAAAQGRIGLTASVADHLYLCLACRACETACPSGVQYGRIIEAAREVLGPPGPALTRTITGLALRHLMPHPGRLRLVARVIDLYQRSGLAALARHVLPAGLRRRAAMLPWPSRPLYHAEAEVLPADGARRARVAFLSGCAMSLFFAEINDATVRVLRRNGCEVVVPRGQACCGALNSHNGEAASARAMARRNIDAFPSDVDAIVTNAAGCGAAMKEYGHLLKDDPAYADRARAFSARVRDAGEFLAQLGPRSSPRPAPFVVTYQDPCHLAHGQKVRAEPRALLARVPGLALKDMDGSDRCCGSAGIYNVLQPEMSEALLREKMEAIRATGAPVVVAPNPGCMLQLRYGAQRFGVPVRVMHLMDLLDEAGA
ncbi:MAG: heterodisulfide reductase-related iron-sulfur binding cluster [Armatimonadota bacterium]|nr:heterodisulfide reductase-related iron-sulfur binding cluster [Armatimonadota bacterium]